jgi:hypothetical protein
MVSQTFKIFIAYSRKDEVFCQDLNNHLSSLRNIGLVKDWHDREIIPGTNWENEIDIYLNTADIILLLVSADFIASKYCYGIEMKQAIQRYEEGKAQVVPVILRPTDWEKTPLNKFQALPSNAKPVTLWHDRDEAFLSIVQGISKIIETFEDDLSSKRNVNYSRLQNLLRAKEWRSADVETTALIAELASKESLIRGLNDKNERMALNGNNDRLYFTSFDDIEYLSCEELDIIERLWFKYSKGQFCFSYQMKVLEQCCEDFEVFSTAVGRHWSVNGYPLYFTQCDTLNDEKLAKEFFAVFYKDKSEIKIPLAPPPGYFPWDFYNWNSAGCEENWVKSFLLKLKTCNITNLPLPSNFI